MAKVKEFIQSAIKKPGALRKTLKKKKGQKISLKELLRAAKKKGKTGKRARLAITLRELSKRK